MVENGQGTTHILVILVWLDADKGPDPGVYGDFGGTSTVTNLIRLTVGFNTNLQYKIIGGLPIWFKR